VYTIAAPRRLSAVEAERGDDEIGAAVAVHVAAGATS
jgi:hypothetical protein